MLKTFSQPTDSLYISFKRQEFFVGWEDGEGGGQLASKLEAVSNFLSFNGIERAWPPAPGHTASPREQDKKSVAHRSETHRWRVIRYTCLLLEVGHPDKPG